MRKFDFIKVGAKVRWEDPAINDYDENERKEQEDMVWTVYLIDGSSKNTKVTRDSIILIVSSYGSEAQVFPCELTPYKSK